MIVLAYWAARFWLPQPVTQDQLGYLGGDPDFRAPRFDPASDIALGGRGIRENHLARFSEEMNSTNKYHGERK